MSIEVTMRHKHATPEVKKYAEARAGKLMESFPRVESVRIVIDMQRNLYEAECIVQRKGMTAVGAKEHAANVRAVIDIAVARAEKQLRKRIDKRITAHVRSTDKK